MEATREMARFIAGHSFARLPEGAVVKAKEAIMDCLGVTLAGTVEPAAQIAGDTVRRWGDAPQAGVVGQGFKTSAPQAALVWGTAAHALDFDDVIVSMVGHPSVTLVPVLFTLGASLGGSGEQVIDAYAVGLEVEGKLGRATAVPHYAAGWHTTATLGSLGAAAAACRLLSLGEEKTRMALGVAASQAAGLRQNFGSMTKPFHAGNAARSGIVAAQLAAAGFTADPGILEAQFGFGNVFCGPGRFDFAPLESLGQPYELEDPGIVYKKYPCCAGTHRTLDAMFALIAAHDLKPADVAEVDCLVSEQARRILIHDRPRLGLQGKFSLQYCVAASLVYRLVGIETFTDEKVNDPRVQELIPRVQLRVNQELAWDMASEYVVITVRTKSGQEYSCRVDTPKGAPDNPMSQAEFDDKFLDCARVILPDDQARQLLDRLQHLESVGNVAELTEQVTLAKEG